MTAGGDPVIDSGQEPRAHLAYRPTRSDYVRINVALIRRSNAAMAVGTFLTVIGGVAVAAGDLFAVLSGVVGLAMLSGYLALPVVWYATRRRSDLMLVDVDIDADPSGLSITSPNASNRVRWATYRTARETHEAFLLQAGVGASFFVLKRDSPPDQLDAFREALAQAQRAGARPLVRHLANTPALLTRPDTWFDLVRPGGGVTGLCTLPGGPPGWLRPAMTVRTHLVQTKRVAPGTGVSYGHRYVTAAATTLGLIPLGYNEGIPRAGTNTAQVLVRGHRLTIAGTVCMNQCVVDAGDLPIEEGDEVVLFGPGDGGEPTAQEWADMLGTLSYDIVTRFTAKIPRSYCGVTEVETSAAQADGAALPAGNAPEPGRTPEMGNAPETGGVPSVRGLNGIAHAGGQEG